MSRWQTTDPTDVVQERAVYTTKVVAEALRKALKDGEVNLELQARQLAGMAGELGQELLIAAADRCLRSCSWPRLRPRSPQATLRHQLGTVQDDELHIRMHLYRPGVLSLSLQRKLDYDVPELLRDIEIEMDAELWRQILAAR
jgi:hypothetical protein